MTIQPHPQGKNHWEALLRSLSGGASIPSRNFWSSLYAIDSMVNEIDDNDVFETLVGRYWKQSSVSEDLWEFSEFPAYIRPGLIYSHRGRQTEFFGWAINIGGKPEGNFRSFRAAKLAASIIALRRGWLDGFRILRSAVSTFDKSNLN